MTITVNVINALVGPSHILTGSDISNWDDVIGLVTTDPCTFEIRYNNSVFTGSIAKSDDESSLLIGFDDNSIALPGGMCVLVDCNHDPVGDGCVPNVIDQLTDTTKLMVVDEEGCPVGYVSLDDIFDYISDRLDIPRTLCDLISDGIPEGNLVASDRVVTTTGDPACTLKSVPQSQVVCN